MFDVSVPMNTRGSRLFILFLTLVLVSILLVGVVIVMLHSREITLTIHTTPGRGYIGEVDVDGRKFSIAGSTTQRFTLTGSRITYRVIAEHPDPQHPLRLSSELSDSRSAYGFEGEVSQSLLGPPAGSGSRTLSEEEWRSTSGEFDANPPAEEHLTLTGSRPLI